MKVPEFKWWQRLIFKFFGVRRVDILKLALARLEYSHEVCGNYHLCQIIGNILNDLGMLDLDIRDYKPMGYQVHLYIPKFDKPNGITRWNISWWEPSRYDIRKEFLLWLIKYYKYDKKRLPINIYHYD